MPELAFFRHGEELLRVALGETTRVGRAPECDVSLPDPMISRVQAVVERRGDAYVLIDRSGRGTAVNGAEVTEAPLSDGSEIGLGTTIWSPLASGLLTGKYNNGLPEGTRASLPGYEWLREEFEKPETAQKIEKVKQLVPIAQELDCTLAQLALAWCLTNPNVSTVITGASKVSQVTENMKALDVLPKLTPDVLQRIEQILSNKPELAGDFR